MKKSLLVLMFWWRAVLCLPRTFSVGIGVGSGVWILCSAAASASACGRVLSAESRAWIRLGFRLLYPCRTALRLARGILDPATLCWSGVGGAALRRPSLLQRATGAGGSCVIRQREHTGGNHATNKNHLTYDRDADAGGDPAFGAGRRHRSRPSSWTVWFRGWRSIRIHYWRRFWPPPRSPTRSPMRRDGRINTITSPGTPWRGTSRKTSCLGIRACRRCCRSRRSWA